MPQRQLFALCSLPIRKVEVQSYRNGTSSSRGKGKRQPCDGNRPSCNACLRRGTECKFEAEPKETHFQALKRKHDSLQGEASSLQQVYDLLRTRPEDEALSIFHKIRDGESHASILQFVHHGDLLLQLSLTGNASPRTDGFSRDDTAASSTHSESQSPLVTIDTSSATSTQSHTRQDSLPRRESTATPFDQHLECQIVEPLLDEVRPSRWTTVSADDEMMKGLLSRYFQLQYRWGSIFHKDYFLRDMISGEQTHCSPLLVNVVLACALHATRNVINRHRYWEPAGNPDCQFFAEARKLWDVEQKSGSDRPTTVQAGLLLSFLHGLDSFDRMGWKCMVQSIEIADNLGLFDTDKRMADDPKVQHALAYTAWAAFCWQSLWCHHFFVPPLIRRPPAWPLPDPHDEPEWYGEILVRYPGIEQLYSTGHGHLLRAKADFSTTINNLSDKFFQEPNAGMTN
ncbi:C6 transcription factor [Coniochaeta hoffmannii]|uniref:C6 transcription factor n=1 Tax=Coniochaeta hoffmannii TaxID=91930 RepID=A0AA38VZU1_9PEZI|nr:C6 transcription factor [Coniochaeta hoffmannii]